MSDILDLDALEPKGAKVKISGVEHDVKPPTTAQVMKLASIGSKLQEVGKLQDDELNATIAELHNLLRDCIPELGERQLNIAQLTALLSLIIDMGMPKDAKELEKQGVTGEELKKDQSD